MNTVLEHQCSENTFYLICELVDALKEIEGITGFDSDSQECDVNKARRFIVNTIYSVCVDSYQAGNEV